MRRAAAALVAATVLAGCGSSETVGTTAPAKAPTTAGAGTRPVSGGTVVAALGDSITAGSPIYDPDPAVRAQIGADLNVQSQYEYWFHKSHPTVTFHNCGVFGERTDEIAQRLSACVKGAQDLIIQGGINDIVQGRPVADAAADLQKMVQAGKADDLKVGIVEVLPWNNGYPDAAPQIEDLNRRIHALAKAASIPVYPWYHALEDPANPARMRPDLTIDGDHPSVAGYRILASKVTLPA